MELSLFSKYQVASELTSIAAKKSHESERGVLLTEFTDTINIARLKSPFKPTTIKRVAMLVSHIPTKDLYYLLSVCKSSGKRNKNYAEGFSKKFYFELKPVKK